MARKRLDTKNNWQGCGINYSVGSTAQQQLMASDPEEFRRRLQRRFGPVPSNDQTTGGLSTDRESAGKP